MNKLAKIIQHAKYNAHIFTGLDTEGAKKNTDYEVEQIKSLIRDEVIGQDEVMPPTKPVTKFSKPTSIGYRNSVRAEQRKRLDSL